MNCIFPKNKPYVPLVMAELALISLERDSLPSCILLPPTELLKCRGWGNNGQHAIDGKTTFMFREEK